MDTTTLMKIELLRMKHARALCMMRIATEDSLHATYHEDRQSAIQLGREAQRLAIGLEDDLEKLIAESQPVTKS